MCAHYEPAIKPECLRLHFDVSNLPPGFKTDLWPGYHGPFILKYEFTDVDDNAVPFRELMPGSFGLIPHWSKGATIALSVSPGAGDPGDTLRAWFLVKRLDYGQRRRTKVRLPVARSHASSAAWR